MKEISEVAELFSEINIKVNLVKQREEFKRWMKTPLKKGQILETRVFPVILWENTPEEKVYKQRVTKFARYHVAKRV